MVTVIIPTKNRASLLSAMLCSIEVQTLAQEEFEVLIVDNGSTDATPSVVEDFKKRIGNIRYLYAPEPGLHVGRHLGLKEAKSDILIYADDDIEATPKWLEAIKIAFNDPTVALVGGNNVPKFEVPPPTWLLKMWNKVNSDGWRSIPSLSILEIPLKNTIALDPYYVWGCNFAIRKSILLKAGGFHPDGMPKELKLYRGDGETQVSQYIKKQNFKCLFVPGATIYHIITADRMTFEYFKMRAFNQGISDSFTELRNPSTVQNKKEYSPLKMVRSLLLMSKIKIKKYLTSKDIRELNRIMSKAYTEGVLAHKNLYEKDLFFKAWVTKKDYF